MDNREQVNNNSGYPNLKQATVLIGLYLALYASFFLGAFTVPQLLGLSLSSVYLNAGLCVSAITIFGPVIYHFSKKSGLSYLWRFRVPNFKVVIVIVCLALSMRILTPLLSNPFLFIMRLSQLELEKLIMDVPSLSIGFILYLVQVLIITPVLEEVLYRKLLLTQLLKRFNPLIAIVISSVAYSLMHIDPSRFLLLVSIGMAFGMVYYYTKSIELSILLHSLYNVVTAFSERVVINYDSNTLFQEGLPMLISGVFIVIVFNMRRFVFR